MKAKLLEKKDGYLAASDLIDRDPTELTIYRVDPGEMHPNLDEPNLVIQFKEIDDAFHVNFRTEQEFRDAWGRAWSGNKVHMSVVRTLMRGYLVYALKATPLLPCEDCGEYTHGRTPKGKVECDWCRML